ncbi:MAG: ammonium transporter [Burkholderiales bacterium]|nr:ammonium transporter [Rhodocyclaceae bacterium]MCA3022677.1 ammonium transporter [Rhodocyclaceae bacterium]MCA3054401.1 ammonium transporter [Rhodocyclaceae bacterium]MCA3055616.1 ammonium transporter [Rhodocyclaceae bacterium]
MKTLFASVAIALMVTVGSVGLASAQDKKAEPPTPSAAAAAATSAAPTPAAAAAPTPAAAAAVPAAAPPAPVPNKGDVSWMLVSTALVLLMSVPALALFYGGLVRSKNMLSVLMQVFVTFSLITVLWVVYGYSLAFTEGNAFIGGFDRLFFKGIADVPKGEFAMAATFSKGVVIPEMLFAAFQCTFAAITCCLILGSVAERMKFSAVLLFVALWFTFSYAPIAHMVWFWMGPDAYTDPKLVDGLNAKAGLLWQWGALDFAGGTVVHINAGVAGLVAAYMLGKRVGYGKEALTPHSLTMTMIGASMLWFGWFGFNAGSALEAGNSAVLAFMNTFLATACAVLSWTFAEWLLKGKPSMLGAASGAVAGLVAITPAAGNVGIPGAFVIGTLAGLVCLWGVTGLKRLLKADDSLDVFGVHAVGGILGALLTGVFVSPDLGGPGFVTDWVKASTGFTSIGEQVLIQAKAVGLAVVWSGVVTAVVLFIVKMVVGLRVSEDDEREGLDIASHGETAYNK